MRRILILVAAAAMLAVGTAPAGAVDAPRPFDPDQTAPFETDAVLPQYAPPVTVAYAFGDAFTNAVGDGFDEFTGDPLRLVVWPRDMRRHSVGEDQIGVYICSPDAAPSIDLVTVTNTLNSDVDGFYDQLSGGIYQPLFVPRAVIKSSNTIYENCVAAMRLEASTNGWEDDAVFGVLDNGGNGGLGGPGFHCANCESSTLTTFPSNDRWAVVDGGAVASYGLPVHLTTAAHEVGHTISFPHSYSGESGYQYDNPIDYMSGNMPGDLLVGRADEPYGSLAFNRYRAGWVDPSDVVFYNGGVAELTLAPAGVDGTQMVILPTDYQYSFVALDARLNSPIDPIPDNFEGVSAHYIEQWCEYGEPPNTYIDECGGLMSRPYSYPPSPYAIDHVTPVGGKARFDIDKGEELRVQGAKLEVLEETANGLVIKLIGFDDVADSIFLDDILWLAESGITRGCSDTSYCPKNTVTRGQMAAFLVRALELTADGGGNTFVDDDFSVFQDDIAKLAAAGITTGCNPPVNDNFCPTQRVTREQMAAFLRRALG